MKKTRLALALSACLMAGSAMAQSSVTVSGLVDAYVGSMKNSGDTGSKSSVGSGGMTTSWIGFKGVEDLGGGLRAEFALTSFFQTDTGAYGRFSGDNLFSRDANIGLSGEFGKVSLGRGLAPSFLPTVLFNPFGDSFTFSPLVLHVYTPSGSFGARTWPQANAADSGWSNEVIYTTPKFGGLQANLHYQFGEVAGDNGKKNIGVNALYFNGGLALTALYFDAQVSNPNSGAAVVDATTPFASINRQKTWMLGATYDFQVIKLYGTYQTSKDTTAGASQAKDKVMSAGLSIPVGNGSILAAIARTKRTGDLLTTGDVSRNTTSVGYDYFLSKRTDVYAIVMNDKISSQSNAASFGLGIRHRF
ncbi:porin [Herbaspirillum huttiense F1]|uniref:Porin n=1 Tax=Herbaspirillum huttiense subsp. lycopersici TaxID=3074428 RepID=A0ABU2EVQ9_9BURK|nr:MULTISPECIES: porin [Herbaspirillum]MBP1317617.1 putative porin [Herbaspirillum sp. 1130]MDR6742434.1 putative porin [Herbaspirillum sp. 1173]MDR9851907.1 porin [Herbaspirillum huttiense SE1]MDT0359074.1 porin [Herbaspirillum huttiense F1]QBP77494.1 porin [Herbaspirillum huttiense]